MSKWVLVLLFLFAGCSSEKEDSASNDNQSTFVVEQIFASSLNLVAEYENDVNIPLDIKNKAIFGVNLCFKDPAVNNPIINNEFTISMDEFSSTVNTDTNGCALVFMPFVMEANQCEMITSKNIKIKARGMYHGQQNIVVGLNPIAKSSKSLIDTRFSKISNFKNNTCQNSEIIITQANLKQIKNSSQLGFEFIMTPALKRYLSDGASELENLQSQGFYKVEYKLLANIAGEKILIGQGSKDVLSSENGIVTTLDFKMGTSKIENVQDYSLEFSVELMKNSYFEKRFYEISAQNLSFSISSHFSSRSEFSKEINQKSFFEDQPLSHQSIILSDLEVKSSAILSDSKEQDKRIKKQALRSCFVDNFSGQKVEGYAHRSYSIKIKELPKKLLTTPSILSLKQVTSLTDVNGCIDFDLLENYALFKKYKFEKRILVVESGDMTYELPIAIHPRKKIVDLRKNVITNEEALELNHELVVDNFNYGQISNVENSYYVNRFAQLFFEKKFFLEFRPQVLTQNQGQELELPAMLNFGDFDIVYKYYVGADLEQDKESLDFDLSDYKLVSVSKGSANVSESGLAYTQFSLPLEVSDALYLSVKSYLVIELTPKNALNELEAKKFLIEFYGTSARENSVAHQNFTLPKSDNELDDSNSGKTPVEKLIATGLHKKTDKSSIELYQAHLQKMNKYKNLEILSSDEALNHSEFKDAKINAYDLRLLSQVRGGNIPKSGGLLAKVCDLIYPRALDIISRKSCLSDVSSHIKISSGEHIEEVVFLNLFEQENKVAKAQFQKNLEVNDADITRGRGFMVAAGDRAGETRGIHEGVAESLSANVFYDGPPGVLLLNAGISKTHEVFLNKDNAKMQMILNRYSSQITPVKLTYNAIGLTFPANTKKCVLIEYLKRSEQARLVCDSRATKKMVTEKWYYIGEADARKHGVLTDGVKMADKNTLKIIRGEDNFNVIWKKFEQEDAKALIFEMEGDNLGEKLLDYKRSSTINLEFEMSKDNNFPGLIK